MSVGARARTGRFVYMRDVNKHRDVCAMPHVTQPVVLHECATPVVLFVASVGFAVAGYMFRTVYKQASKQI